MPLDPSYLRAIRDGILKGNIEANNIEALPDGLTGLYDKELFPPSLKWKERRETLQFFLVFALAQKEISADFAASILGDEWSHTEIEKQIQEAKPKSEEEKIKEERNRLEDRLKRVNELIQLHSKRFTAAAGGKYRLYHDRFRVYILQKALEDDILLFNQKFIKLCEVALKNNTEKEIPEKELYALEFLSTHYYISALQGNVKSLNKNHAELLKKYAYDQTFWNRQIKASKGFEWSKKMLNEMMAWASKFNEDDEVIECALNKVDLYHQEQNDAPRIVQLVAEGDIETALERIEKFGGDDKEGLQRKFTLYMLCLMELTILDSKQNTRSKKAITTILEDLKKQNQFFDNNYFDWSTFFPEVIVLQLVCEWNKLKYDGDFIFEMTNKLDIDWVFFDMSSIERKVIKSIFTKKTLASLNNDKVNRLKNLVSSPNTKSSSRWKKLELNKLGIASFEFLEKKYLNNDVEIELNKIEDPIILFPIINKLLSRNFNHDSRVLEKIFTNVYNGLSKHYRLLNLNILSNILSKYSWTELNRQFDIINLDDSDVSHNLDLFNQSLKKKLIKFILIRKWLRKDPGFMFFINESLQSTENSESSSIDNDIFFKNFEYPMFLYKMLNNEELLKISIKSYSVKKIAYAFGKIFTTENDMTNLKCAIKKQELFNYRIYIMMGVAEGFNPKKNTNFKEIINIVKDYPNQLSIILNKIENHNDNY